MFEDLDGIDWKRTRHCYGRATDAPRWIRALDSDDLDDRSEAVNHFLWSCVFHQYTLYPATPFVIPFVIEALRSSALSERDSGSGTTMKRELLHFVRLCAEGGQRSIQGTPHPDAPTIEEAVMRGASTYRSYLGDDEPGVAEDAARLVEWCHRAHHHEGP